MACRWCTMPGGEHDDGCPYDRITQLEAAVLTLSTPKEYTDLVGYHSGVRSVYGQALYEGRGDIAEWMQTRWLAALDQSTPNT